MDYCYHYYLKYKLVCQQSNYKNKCNLVYNKTWNDCINIHVYKNSLMNSKNN